MGLFGLISGNTDTPVEDAQEQDALGMSHFATALADFLCHCGTPLTVGIQGEWGSGKTSLMNMVHRELEGRSGAEDTPPFLFHTFETWQYGTLGDDRTLGLQLLANLVDEVLGQLEEGEYISRKGRRLMTNMKKMAGAVAGMAAGAATGGLVDAGQASNAVDSIINSGGGQSIQEIRNDFADLVAEASRKIGEQDPSNQPGRLVIFVDDLDRIRPARAVSLLEVLKNFMEVPNCLFVLACDYEVIRRGVRDKFGIEGEEKARAFFDKIIQVPFQMPVGQYELDKLLEEFLYERLYRSDKNGYGKSEAEDLAMELAEELAPLVQLATGTNPRSFKRYLNTLDLLTCVESARAEGTPPWTLTEKIFCRTLLVALQVGWESVANYLDACEDSEQYAKALRTLRELGLGRLEDISAEDANDLDLELIELLKSEYSSSVNGADEGDWLRNPKVTKLGTFGAGLFDLLDKDQNGTLEQDEIKIFITVTEELSLTSVNRKQQLSGWHQFRHSVRENCTGDRSTRMGTARRFRRLARKLYDQRKSDVVSVQRHKTKFNLMLDFDGQKKVIELNDELAIKIREREDPESSSEPQMPTQYCKEVGEFVEQHSDRFDASWRRTSWGDTQYWEFEFDARKPTAEEYKYIEDGLVRLIRLGSELAEQNREKTRLAGQ